MADKNIKNFLPSVFRTNKIKNFMDSTTETLFDDKNFENKTYFVGRKAGGLFQPLNDYYAQERTKLRDDYQLEPTLVVRDRETGNVDNALFYEDLLNALRNNGSYTEDHARLFRSDAYSFAPPIDVDMFINYSDYYWYPEGAPAYTCDANKEDIEGLIETTLRVTTTNTALKLSSGHHIVLNDGKEYIVEGVGRSIKLIEFSPEDNKPYRIDRVIADTTDVDELVEKFPAEYVSMDRGASDHNPWSRNNSWYHKDVLVSLVGEEKFVTDRSRRAQRPIICFKRDIELFNYGNHVEYVQYFHDGGRLLADEGDLVIEQGEPYVYLYTNSGLTVHRNVEHNDKVTFTKGDLKADEYRWDAVDSTWIICQRKVSATQPIMFNLYDSNDVSDATLLSDTFKYPESDFQGTPIFSYGVDEEGIEDPVLGFPLEYKAFKESSDIVFHNHMDTAYTYSGGTLVDGFYKVRNPERIDSDNVLRFTVVKRDDGTPVLYINDEYSKNIVLKADTQYRLDFSDSSTTARGWFDDYSPITVMAPNGDVLVKPTHADSAQNRVLITFPDLGSESEYYTYKTDNFEGRIYAVPETTSDVEFGNSWELSGNLGITLKKEVVFGDQESPEMELDYIPANDRFRVNFNGDQVLPQDYEFDNNTIKILSVAETTNGDFMEVFYTTHDRVSTDTDTIQRVYGALNNNPFNANETEFAFSEIFDQFRSIIRNQPYIEGTALTDNNFRDTQRNGAYGDVIQRHSNPIVPLMFMNNDKFVDVVQSMIFAKDAYNAFKTSLLSGVEEYVKHDVIDNSNVRDIFDNIVTDINNGRNKSDSFAYSYMFATYNKYTNVTFDSSGVSNLFMEPNKVDNELYIYTDAGLRLVGIDYDLESDETILESKIVPKTFQLNDIVEARYYEEMEPSFCPATPMKFGLDKPKKPAIQKDETYLEDRYFIIGHDGSKTLAFSTKDEIESGELDGRDLVILEFETRVYNGIASEFKSEENYIFDMTRVTPSNYYTNRYSKQEIRDTEFSLFHKWTYDNNINYTANSHFNNAIEDTYNFSNIDTDNGEVISGHWKAIFEYYYGTTTPHLTPWEVLGFRIKPSWWESEYGTDYSSQNTAMWTDLEEGIVRHGERKNDINFAYKSTQNRLRKEGLLNILPVDESGKRRTVTDIGFVDSSMLSYTDIKREWAFGEFGPVEQAWRNSSDYSFVKQIVYYILNPLEFASKAWDSTYTVNLGAEQVHEPKRMAIHSFGEGDDGFTYVAGLTQWVYGYLQNKNLSGEKLLRDAYSNTDVVLAHKVGGYIDSTNLTVTTETFNPRSGNTITTIPEEDVSVLTHESKDIIVDSYSGVLVERVSADKEYYDFIEGHLYDVNDVVFNAQDNNYYKLTKRLRDFPEWEAGHTYVSGRVAIYGGQVYTATETTRADDNNPPSTNSAWKLRGFMGSDWALLPSKPKSKTTYFKVFGYDMYDSEFLTIPASSTSRDVNVIAHTSDTEQLPVIPWEANKSFKKGQYSRLSSEAVFVCLKDHTSGESIDLNLWKKTDKVPLTGVASVNVRIDGMKGAIKRVPYGTVFKTETEVADFLMAYGRYLESRGWVFDSFDKARNKFKNWMMSVEEFIQWAYENKAENNIIGLSPISENIKYHTPHGVSSITRDKVKREVALTDERGRIIDIEQCEFNRLDNELTLTSPVPVYYCKVTVKEYEHIITFNNKTVFNDVIYEPALGIRKDRLMIRTNKSLGWDGRLRAEGFIISGNKLLPNFETSVSDLKTIASTDTLSIQNAFNRLKYHNYGYERREYLEDLGLDDKAQMAFYSGFIRQKGTAESFQRLLRSSELDVNENMDINEEWAFKEATFGGVENNQFIEIAFDRSTVKSSPQLVQLEYAQTFENKRATDVYIDINDRDTWLSRPTRYAEDKLWVETQLSNIKKTPTAGYVRWSDADFKAFSLATLGEQIRKTNKKVVTGQRAWIAKDTSEQYGWNVFESRPVEFTVDEIITHGKDNVSSMVLRMSNVDESFVYGLHDGKYQHVFRLKRLKEDDNVYIALPYNEDAYLTLDQKLKIADIQSMNFVRWAPMRVNQRYYKVFPDVIDTIDAYVTENSITPIAGQKLYIDDTIGEVSYRELVLNHGPLEYWSFADYSGQVYAGEYGTDLVPQDASSVDSGQKGILGTLGSKAKATFEPASSTWPVALWAEHGTDSNSTVKGFEVWIHNDGDVVFQDTLITHTIAGFVHVDETTGEYASIHLGVHPETDTTPEQFRVMYNLNGSLEHSFALNLEKGFNHIYIQYENDTDATVTTIMNGTRLDVTSGLNSLDSSKDYSLYTVALDTAEIGSNMPRIDEMAIYDTPLSLLNVQKHVDHGMNGLFKGENPQQWGVYQYTGSSWELSYKEENVIDTRRFKDVTLYDGVDDSVIGNLNIHDPVKGYFSGAMLDEVDYITEYDPATYNNDSGNYSTWGSKFKGTVWWDTSTMRYLEYENGSVDERSNFWGTLFPESRIDIYEWVESPHKPSEYEGTGIIYDTEQYVVEQRYDASTTETTNVYYFWVRNTSTIQDDIERKVSVTNIANSIQFPENNGIPYIEVLDNESFVLNDINNQIIQNDVVVQINYELAEDTSQVHTQWKLISEDEREDELPSFVFDKMIDSLLGYRSFENVEDAVAVPNPALPAINRYGNGLQQGWFKNIKEARKNFVEVINVELRDLNIWDIDLFWEEGYDEIFRATDSYGLVDWFAEDYDPSTIVSNLVNKRFDAMLLPLKDGEYVKVNEAEGRMPSVYTGGYTIYRYVEEHNTYEKVAQANASIQFKESFFTNDVSPEESMRVRNMLDVIFNKMLVSNHSSRINRIFFAMVRYVFSEQPANDWVFPSTYINVNQESRSLVKKRVYQSDKEEQLIEYITESKPFHTKLRAINKIHTGDVEHNGFYVTDFDKPPFLTENRDIVILQEQTIDTIPYRRDRYYQLAVQKSKPQEYWKMDSVSFELSRVYGIQGGTMQGQNDQTTMVPESSGVSFSKGLRVAGAIQSTSVELPSSKMALEAWVETKDNGVTDTTYLYGWKIINANRDDEYGEYIVSMDYRESTPKLLVQAFRNGETPYLEEHLDVPLNQVNYVVLNVDNSKTNNKLSVVINDNDAVEYDVTNMMTVSGNHVAEISLNSESNNGESVLFDEFALYARNLTKTESDRHYAAASESDSQLTFDVENIHSGINLGVYIEGVALPTTGYTLSDTTLRLTEEPPRALNHVSNIVIKSRNVDHQSILDGYDQARGYNGVSKSNLREFMSTVNQKRTHVFFDRVSLLPSFNLEELVDRYNTVTESDEPLRAFTEQSIKFANDTQRFTETDRIVTNMYFDDLVALVDASFNEIVSAPVKKNFTVDGEFTKNNILVFVNDQVVKSNRYTVSTGESSLTVKFKFNVYKNDLVTVRPKDQYEALMAKVSHIRGVGTPYKDLEEIKDISFKVAGDTSPVLVDENGELVIDSNYNDMLAESGDTATVNVLYSEFDSNDGEPKNLGKFMNHADKAVPEEKTSLNLKEALVMSFKSNLEIVPRGYETSSPMDIFETVSFKANGGETEYTIDLNVNPEQVLVLVNEDEWVINHHYELEADRIVFIKKPKKDDKVIVTDRYSAFDQYRGRQLGKHLNIQSGGFDGDMVKPDFLNDKEDSREFIVYTQDGKVHVFECTESDAIDVVGDVDYKQDAIQLSSMGTNMALTTKDQGKLAAIYGEEFDGNGKLVSSKMEFIHYTGTDGNVMTDVQRGLFGKNPKIFDSNKYNIKVYPLTIDDELPSFTLIEPYIGVKGRSSYPKYGHIMSGKDT